MNKYIFNNKLYYTNSTLLFYNKLKEINMKNRGSVSTKVIANKLEKIENELQIISENFNIKNKTHTLLLINGKLDRENHTYIQKKILILDSLNKEIKKFCKGSNLTILNYLIFLGLKNLKDNNKLLSIKYSDFASKL